MSVAFRTASRSLQRPLGHGSASSASLTKRFLESKAMGHSDFDASTIPSSSSEKFIVPLRPESFHSYKCEAPTPEVEVTKDGLVWMYENMVAMRRMEQAAQVLYQQKLIRGFCHLTIGQEAVSVGMESAMKTDDKVITSYRCHPFAVLRGGTIKGVVAELLGRIDGMSYGKGGSMHIFTPTFFGGNGIVGAQVPLGAGIAFAQKYLKQDNEHGTFILYGDGAANQGQVFEAFNMAALWKLPAIFICENNQYGMGTSTSRASANVQYYTRGDSIPGIQVNAMDILAVRKGVQFAKEWTTSGKGPLLMEMVTYRYGGHSMSDPGTSYRTRDEVQQMRSNNDPIAGLKTRILEWGVVSEDELKAIDKNTKAEVDQAVEEAKASPIPNPETDLWTDIYYAGTEPNWMRGREKEDIHHFR